MKVAEVETWQFKLSWTPILNVCNFKGVTEKETLLTEK